MPHAIAQTLNEILRQMDQVESFCTSGSVAAVSPGLEVAELGPIDFPLSSKQAKELRKRCQPAPYGKGEETLIDINVRRAWRMTPDQFALTNPAWPMLLRQIVDQVEEGLGLGSRKLNSHLYDLLLYERGGFFLPHRDGEKRDGMVATLVIELPSSYRGGELMIRHGGAEQTFDFSNNQDEPHIHYVAFYADCEHEVRRLQAGHRLCLVYNLTLARVKKRLPAPTGSDHVEAIRKALANWGESDKPRKMIVTLEHQYTKDGLTWNALKGADRLKGRALLEGARQADCKAYLALVEFYEEGSGDDDEVGDDPSDYEMYVENSQLKADVWIDGRGESSRIHFGYSDVEKDEVVDEESLHDGIPEVSIGDYTGNMGMEAARWYYYAAIFLWPRSRHFDILCDASISAAAGILEKMVSRWKNDAKRNRTLRTEAVEFAATIVRRSDGTFDRELLTALQVLGESDLIDSYIKEILSGRDTLYSRDADTFGEFLVAQCLKRGWNYYQRDLERFLERFPSLDLVERFCLARPRKNSGWRELCQSLTGSLVAAWVRGDEKAAEEQTEEWQESNPGEAQWKRKNRSEELVKLFRSLIAVEHEEMLSRLVPHILAKPGLYPISAVHLPTLSGLEPWLRENLKKPSAALSHWLASLRQQLETLTAQKPKRPTDFRRPSDLVCNCPVCDKLKRFLDDPHEKEHGFLVNRSRYRHLEATIDRSRCDLDYELEKGEAGHTMRCTKNTDSYKVRQNAFGQAQKDLKVLRALQQTISC